MKKLLTILFVALLVLAACGPNKEKDEATPEQDEGEEVTKIKVASLIPPMTDMLEAVKDDLLEDGVDMEIIILADNVQPNQALKDEEVHANFFQHPPYMEQFNEAHDANLVVITPVYHAMLGAYSNDYDSIDELPEGATIAVPNDSANLARALQLLEKGGLITLKEGTSTGLTTTQKDIEENPKNIQIQEIDLLMLARAIDDVDVVTMLPAYAEPLGLTPGNDSLIDEGESEFPIVVAAREDNQNDEAIQKLAKHMSGPVIEQFIEEHFSDTYMTAVE